MKQGDDALSFAETFARDSESCALVLFARLVDWPEMTMTAPEKNGMVGAIIRRVEMMTTKQFAERIGVSVRTLIRWHQAGILKPAIVLPTGARRYSEEQVEQLRPGAKGVK